MCIVNVTEIYLFANHVRRILSVARQTFLYFILNNIIYSYIMFMCSSGMGYSKYHSIFIYNKCVCVYVLCYWRCLIYTNIPWQWLLYGIEIYSVKYVTHWGSLLWICQNAQCSVEKSNGVRMRFMYLIRQSPSQIRLHGLANHGIARRLASIYEYMSALSDVSTN